jgi:hypothetical protein
VGWKRAVTMGVALTLLTGTAAQAAPRKLSTSDRLKDRREVAAGTRAYSVGFQDGRFYANGWHITGEMGGLWTPPLKLVDGVWFGVNGQWAGPATKFTSGWGYTRFKLPPLSGLRLKRTDFVPDGRRGGLYGLKLSNPSARAKTVTVNVDAHSELMGQFPWGFDGTVPNASDNLPDTAAYDASRGALQFTDRGALEPGLPAHDYSALVGSSSRPASHATGDSFRGPQDTDGEIVCPGKLTDPMPSQCKDGPFGNGRGGDLGYKVTVPRHGSKTVWIAVAGSDKNIGESRQELAKLLQHPDRQLAAKIASRKQLGRNSRVSLPGDRLLQQSIDWGKQNLADLTKTAQNLKIRWTNQGKQFPPPLGTVPSITYFGAGFPDYPWLFATDGEYTNYAAVALGQFDTAKAHLKALKDVSDILNNHSGLVVHETVTDGSVWFGHESQTNGVNDFNTDETAKFPSAVALIWRWTGDNGFRDQMYDFAKRNLHYVQSKLDADGDGWLEGSGNVERTGMGAEKLDNAVYYIRSLYDLADMARSKGDKQTADWATGIGRDLLNRFDNTWWYTQAQQYADSLTDPGNVQSFQKHWIGQTPMEAELYRNGTFQPGIAPFDHGTTALAGRETSEFSGDRPGSRGLFHTGRGGGADGAGDLEIFSLTTAIQAVGEGNYGRLGTGTNPDDANGQRRYTDANAETMFSEPATGGTPDEQPGAMPEIFPSPGFAPTAGQPQGGNISRCWTCRSMFMQAWGNYGTAWPVIHQQLGVSPDLGHGIVSVIPQVPADQPSVQGMNIRLGKGAIDVRAAHSGSTYTTEVDASDTPGRTLVVGHVLPRGSTPTSVKLDGRTVHSFGTVTTNRGVEVTVPARAGERHVLQVVA